MGRVVGIDLGTTNSVVATVEGGKPVVIANAEGMRTTPSVVGFTKDEELVVGQMARRQAVLNPQNTFYAVKRFMGRKYAELQSESKRVPYTVRRDEVGNVRIRCPRRKKDFAPEEVSAMILRKLAEEAGRYLGEPVTKAVITVPAYFNDAQRQATRDAGKIAGLEVLRIINEPTAAALAYGLEQRDSQTILVFDLGGGTFDVSVLDVGDEVCEVRATSGDTQLGGNDFDQRIVDWLAEKFLEQEGVDLRRDRQALQRLTEAAEKAKIELSGVGLTEINLPFITATADGPKHIETKLSRGEFEDLCGDLVARMHRPLKRVLSDAGVSPVQIDEVVLVGGASRMPMVQQLVYSFVDRAPSQNVNPDEVVAVGAAIQGGILTKEVSDILLLDVTPLSIGLETIGGVMKKLLPRNTTIPVRRSDTFSTGDNNQTMVEIHVVQGEREMATDNKSLGRFKLMGIPPAPRGVPQIQVAFDIDANGILQVMARDKTTGREQTVTIQGASNLKEAEVDRMLTEAEQFFEQDRAKRERVEKRNRAQSLADQAQRRMKEVTLDFGSQFTAPYRRQVEALCNEIAESLQLNDERRLDRTQADLQDTLYELNREMRLQYDQEEDDNFLGTIRRTFSGDREDDYFYSPRDPYGAPNAYGNAYGNQNPYGEQSPYTDAPYGNRDPYGERRNRYGNDRYETGNGGNSTYNTADAYGDRPYPPMDRSTMGAPRERRYGDGGSYARNRNDGNERDYPRQDAYRNQPRYGSDRNYEPQDPYGAGNYNAAPAYREGGDRYDRPGESAPRYRQPRPEADQRYYKRGRASIPYENNWDEEDDEWF